MFKQKKTTCLDCQQEFIDGKKLSTHLAKDHNMTFEEYVIKHKYQNVRPLCLHCGSPTRFTRSFEIGFKKYCQNCDKIAESLGGKIGGKIKQTWNKGQTKETNEILKRFAESISGEKNPFYGKHHPIEFKKFIISKLKTPLNEVFININSWLLDATLLTKPEDIKEYKRLEFLYFDVKCNQCENIASIKYRHLRHYRCRQCHPLGSRQQIEVFELVKSLGYTDAESSTRQIIKPLELDIFIPSKNFAIEYNGLYWHAKENGIHKRHLEKHKQCRSKGIFLLQIYSDEWMCQNDACVNLIIESLSDKTVLYQQNQYLFNDVIDNLFLDDRYVGPNRSKDDFLMLRDIDDDPVGYLQYKIEDDTCHIIQHLLLGCFIGLIDKIKNYFSVSSAQFDIDACKVNVDEFVSYYPPSDMWFLEKSWGVADKTRFLDNVESQNIIDSPQYILIYDNRPS